MEEKDRKYLRMLGLLSLVGLTPVFTTVVGFFIGYELDKWLGTSPWLTGIFLLLGIITGFRDVYRYIKKSQEMSEEDAGEKHENKKHEHD